MTIDLPRIYIEILIENYKVTPNEKGSSVTGTTDSRKMVKNITDGQSSLFMWLVSEVYVLRETSNSLMENLEQTQENVSNTRSTKKATIEFSMM